MPRVLASKDHFIDFSIIEAKSLQQNSDGMIVDQSA